MQGRELKKTSRKLKLILIQERGKDIAYMKEDQDIMKKGATREDEMVLEIKNIKTEINPNRMIGR